MLLIDVPAGGKPWIVRPLFILKSNLRVEFADGVVILAKQNAFHWTNDCLLTLDNVTNVTLSSNSSGNGAVLRMRRADYAIPRWPGGCTTCDPYTKGEWRSGIALAGATDILIEGLTVEESGGGRGGNLLKCRPGNF